MSIDIRALIFDMDGVIADTLALHYQSWQQLSRDEDIPFTADQYRVMQGLPRPASLKVFLNGRTVKDETAQELMERKNRYFQEHLKHLTSADSKPGAAELIREARAKGLKVGLGSSSLNARRVLEKLELINLFDVIADGTTVVHNKPAPDIFLWVAEHLDVKPAQAIVFEDAEAGMQAALAGGFWTVGVGNDYDTTPHIALQSLAGVTTSDLQRQLNNLHDHSGNSQK